MKKLLMIGAALPALMAFAPSDETGAAETPTPEAGSEAAAARVELAKSNGVTQPRSGTKTRRVWEIADEISADKGRPALRGEVMEKGNAEGLSQGTIATQYGRWCGFHGVTKEMLKAARDAEKPAETADAGAGEGEPAEG